MLTADLSLHPLEEQVTYMLDISLQGLTRSQQQGERVLRGEQLGG